MAWLLYGAGVGFGALAALAGSGGVAATAILAAGFLFAAFFKANS